MRRCILLSAFALALTGGAATSEASAQTTSATSVAPAPTPTWAAQVVDSDHVGDALSHPTSTEAPLSTVPVTSRPPTTRARAKRVAPTTTAPTATTTTLVGTATLAALVVGVPTAAVLSANDPATWAALRKCESGGRYDLNTGNGFYGAYQFGLGTWQKLGYSGVPSDAPPAVQDEAARKLQARSGWGPWPDCARRLGLR